MHKLTSFIAFFVVCVSSLLAQNNSVILSPKEKELLDKAKLFANKGNNKKALSTYNDLLNKRPDYVPAILNTAGIYYSDNNFVKAEEFFAKAIKLDPEGNPEVYYSQALTLMSLKKYADAAREWKNYMDREKKNTQKIEKARLQYENAKFIDQAMKNPKPFAPISLGPNVNSPLSEYLPFLSLDGSAIVFTRNNDSNEDFYSTKIMNGQYSQAQELRGMNTYQNEGAHTISADGKYMVFTACDRRDAFGECDLYFSTFEKGKWTTAMNMGHIVNSAAKDRQPSLSADGRTLYFNSNRLGTLGGDDIWMTFRDNRGKWVTPINLGSPINTQYNDSCPFLHGDGQTMYFTSDGHPGMGSRDIYFSRKEGKKWSQPQNLGYPINTTGEEGPICVSLDGTKAYFSSDFDYQNKLQRNNLDLYYFDIPVEARPIASTYLKGYVKDAKTNAGLSADVIIKNLDTGEEVFVVKTSDDGYFVSGLAKGAKYAAIAKREGYVYKTLHFDFSENIKDGKPYILDILLDPIVKPEPQKEPVVSKPVILNNIFFETGSDVLLPSSDSEINLIVELMQTNSSMRVKISGHTDNVGSDTDNLSLSQRRAKSVVTAIVKKGIDASRLESEGKGETMPIDTNDTPEGRQRNRRTEFLIL